MIEAIKQGNDGTASTMDGIGCAYRGSNNNKCAVGCFIPDDLYRSSFESVWVRNLPQNIIDIMPLNVEGMVLLQEVHDDDSDNVREAMIEWIEDHVQD
jgi:hypothetical protein